LKSVTENRRRLVRFVCFLSTLLVLDLDCCHCVWLFVCSSKETIHSCWILKSQILAHYCTSQFGNFLLLILLLVLELGCV
jgi:flagellar biosynthesis protein FliR